MKCTTKVFWQNIIILILFGVGSGQAQNSDNQWSQDKAWKWYKDNPWICGFNYIPANAIKLYSHVG